MAKVIKRKVRQLHFLLMVILLVLILCVAFLIGVVSEPHEVDKLMLALYLTVGMSGFAILSYLVVYFLSGYDYFDDTGMVRKGGKEIRGRIAWTSVQLLKYRRLGGIIPVCSIGVLQGAVTGEEEKKCLSEAVFSSGVVLCMRKKKFQEIIDLIPEDLKQNMQIEV